MVMKIILLLFVLEVLYYLFWKQDLLLNDLRFKKTSDIEENTLI